MIAAAVQMSSGPDVARNLARARELVGRAARQGAELVVLPENFALMSSDEEAKFGHAETLPVPGDGGARPGPPGPIVAAMAEAAAAAGAFVVLGGMPERPDGRPDRGGGDERKVHNSCVLLGPDGAVRAVYRKIHLFDVAIPDGATYQESKAVAAGDRPVVAETPWGGLGLSVCYDLRFPELYRAHGAAGARMVVVPAAFTLHTGRDHWHLLLRARAVENLVFVIAAAQWGRHDEKRVTYGHSLIVHPWGTVLAEAADGEGLAVAELDFAQQDRLRRELPALGHRRL